MSLFIGADGVTTAGFGAVGVAVVAGVTGTGVAVAVPFDADAGAAAAAGAESCCGVSFSATQEANWPMILSATSEMTPRPNWATLPVTARSVSTVTLVPSPSATSCAVIVALALP